MPLFCRVVKKHFEQLRPLGMWDPLFLPLFVLLCPENELPNLIFEIPVYLSASFMVWILKEMRTDSEVYIRCMCIHTHTHTRTHYISMYIIVIRCQYSCAIVT